MDIPIAIVLDILIFLAYRPFLRLMQEREFWFVISGFNAVALVARLVLDQIMDSYRWDRLEANGYDAILSMFVFVVPAVILGAGAMVWSHRQHWRR